MSRESSQDPAGKSSAISEIKWLPGDTDPVVWINVPKLDTSWKHDSDFYVSRGARGGETADRLKYRKFGAWFRQSLPVLMPRITIDNGRISFTNGRHRFAWLRDHGVCALPVTISPGKVAEVRRLFGTKSRTSRLFITRRKSRRPSTFVRREVRS